MRRLTVLLLVFAGCETTRGPETKPPEKISYIHDLNAGLEKARAEGKPAAILFTADW